MDNNVQEIAYNLLQYEYLKRKKVFISESNLKKIFEYFPEDWHIRYSLDDRIKIISLALKNNVDIEEVIQEKNR